MPREHVHLLSIEWSSVRLWGHAHGIVTKILHKIRFTFCLSKTGPCAIISSQISSKFTGEVAYYLLCMPQFHLWCQCSQLSRILSQREMSDNNGFGPFNRQVAITLATLTEPLLVRHSFTRDWHTV